MLSRSDRPSVPHPIHTSYNNHHSLPSQQASSMDSAAVDFRAFYPYTPNEVKHRKRTTNAQLKTLETIFKRDTKPNGTLRVDLAAQLGMTARGVQVWFQNRRAKEKLRISKAVKANKTDISSQDLLTYPSDKESPATSPAESRPSPPSIDAYAPADSPSQSSSPTGASPLPQVQVIHEASQTLWESPSNALSLSVDPHLHTQRRGSLPVNMLPYVDFSPNGPPLVDAFDPLARRLSVDASLQRLANNPYAPLARAKNGAVYGPRTMAPIRRSLNRYGHYPQRTSASIPYSLGVRRASMGTFRVSPPSTISPSPSPYSVVRTSLPSHHLCAVTSRTLSSPIPGPLPSPNFSFGAANTPSMISTSSGDSEGNSPVPSPAFSYREPEQDDEDGNAPAPYYSRFGSIASIATSDSSINSSYYPEVAGCFPDDEYPRRDSCTSGYFSSLMSTLGVNEIQDPFMNSQGRDTYGLQEDMNASGVIRVNDNGVCIQTSTYPSPTSTISPEPTQAPSGETSPVPLSRSSELAYALQGHSDQVLMQTNATTSEQISLMNSSVVSLVIGAEDNQARTQYSYTQDAGHLQNVAAQSATSFGDKYTYDYNPSGPFLAENYSVLEGGDVSPLGETFNVRNVPYNPTVNPLEPISPNTDIFVAYV